jgi:hypothetical protein
MFLTRYVPFRKGRIDESNIMIEMHLNAVTGGDTSIAGPAVHREVEKHFGWDGLGDCFREIMLEVE